MQKDIEELGESINNAFDQRNVQMLAKRGGLSGDFAHQGRLLNPYW